MHNHEQALMRGVTDSDQAFLVSGGVGIWKGGREGVVERADRFIECDLVLPSVGVCLRAVPSVTNALLARSSSRLWPKLRITSGMQDCQHYDALGFHTIEDSIREARN